MSWPSNRTEFGPNRTPILAGLSYTDETSVIPVAVDPTTGYLLTSGQGGTSSAFGSAFPADGTAVGATDGTDMQPLQVDGNGYLEVNVKAGASAGTQYTTGTSEAAPIGTVALGWDGTDVKALPLDGSGYLKVAQQGTVAVTGTFWQTTQPVSWSGQTVTVTQATSSNLKAQVDVHSNALVSTPLVGQTKVATTGTAAQLNGGTSQSLTNGVIISAPAGNSGPISVGGSGVNNTQDGTGNGYLLVAGASVSFAVADVTDLYINGTSGDFVSWAGS